VLETIGGFLYKTLPRTIFAKHGIVADDPYNDPHPLENAVIAANAVIMQHSSGFCDGIPDGILTA
jgi:hypothetical protein